MVDTNKSKRFDHGKTMDEGLCMAVV